MASTPFATSADVEARWRTLSEEDRDRADVLTYDASAMIRERWGDVDARIASGDISNESVIRVVASMVRRAMIAGDAEGLESRAQAAGIFSVNDKFANPMGNLYFTAADILVFEPEGSRSAVYQGWLA